MTAYLGIGIGAIARVVSLSIIVVVIPAVLRIDGQPFDHGDLVGQFRVDRKAGVVIAGIGIRLGRSERIPIDRTVVYRVAVDGFRNPFGDDQQGAHRSVLLVRLVRRRRAFYRRPAGIPGIIVDADIRSEAVDDLGCHAQLYTITVSNGVG